MAHATELATEDIRHANWVGARYRVEWCGMTVTASQPQGVRAVQEAHMGHFLGIAHDDIEIKDIHALRTAHPSAGIDRTFTQCAHPVGETDRIARQIAGRLVVPLQKLEIGVGWVIEIVEVDGAARRTFSVSIRLCAVRNRPPTGFCLNLRRWPQETRLSPCQRHADN